MTQQQTQLYTPPQLAEYLGIELGALQMTFYRLKLTGWNKRQQFTEEQQQQLIEKYRGISDNNNNTPSVSKPTATTTTNKKTMTTTTITNNIKKTDNIILEPPPPTTTETTTQDAKEQPPTEQQQQQQTEYDKRPLAAFCASLFVVNLIVVLPNVGAMEWYLKLGGVMVCAFAPFLEYRYSHILIEIWAKAKTEERQGVLRYFYTEGLAVALLIPAMIFQSHDVYQLSFVVLKPVTYFEKALPIFLAFSYQLFGLMQTLHLPKKKQEGDKEQ